MTVPPSGSQFLDTADGSPGVRLPPASRSLPRGSLTLSYEPPVLLILEKGPDRDTPALRTPEQVPDNFGQPDTPESTEILQTSLS